MIDNKYAKNRIRAVAFALIWCAQMLAAVYFCCQKQGFHEDEYYTYYSTARTYGLIVEDGAWMEHDAYFNEFVVLEGQGFQYGLVKLVQSWDVHPPVYYWIFHTVCSLFPGRFSKWFGLGVNLAAFGVSLFLLRILARKVTGKNEKLACLVCLFYGFTPAAISSVVFIRMYALLTVWVLLCAVLHVSAAEHYAAYQENKKKKAGAEGKRTERESAEREKVEGGARYKLPVRRFLLPLAVVTYLGFLTQYYYFIFLFFMAAAFCLFLLWQDRRLGNCIRYGVSVAAAFVLAFLTYPSCLGQMFRGQRGAQATENFFDLSNTFERLFFFWQLLDRYVFGRMLSVILLLMAAFFLCAVGKRHIRFRGHKSIAAFLERNFAYALLLVTAAGYFLAVSKTALLLGDTSIRYQTPIYGIIVLLLFGAVGELAKRYGKPKRLFAAAMLICLFVSLAGLLSGRVVFLYPEDADRIAFARENEAQGTPVVCLYDAGQSWCIWDCADEFFEYSRIYFASQDGTGAIEDETIKDSDRLLVYLSHTADEEAQLQRILDGSPNLGAYELLWQEKYCDVYWFD